MNVRLFSSLIAAAVLVGSVATARAEPPAALSVPDARFGIAEGYRNAGAMADLGAGWERLVFSWADLQPVVGDFGKLRSEQGLDGNRLRGELNRGVRVAGLIQFTPGWAAENGGDGGRSVPRNLFAPYNASDNYFGRFVYETVKQYSGRYGIHEWIIWNEPEFRESDAGAGGSYTWKGSDEQFAQLMKVGYRAAHDADPNAVVSFPGTSYWVEQNQGRTQFYERVLRILASDPEAPKFNYFHDAVSLNLYRAPDDVYRVHGVFKAIQRQVGIDKPVWLTETNAMPSDDRQIPCSDRHTADKKFVATSMEQQAAYAVQAFALAAAAGYQKIEFYQIVDQNPCEEPEVWGATRDDGSRRPVADALKAAIQNFSGYSQARFVPLKRETNIYPNRDPIWPDDPKSLVPNWQVYQVALDRPGNQRVTALWNGDGSVNTVRVKKNGSTAKAVDRRGNERPLQENQGWWVVDLPAATAYFKINEQIKDPEGYHFIGGDPLLIVEEGVDPNAPLAAPRLGLPGAVAREFVAVVEPSDQTVGYGAPADFYLRTISHEDFNDPITLRISQWSTQRFPDPQDGSSFPMGVGIYVPQRAPEPGDPGTPLPVTLNPGDTATIRFNTADAPEPGIYFVTLEASGGGQTRTVDLALVLN